MATREFFRYCLLPAAFLSALTVSRNCRNPDMAGEERKKRAEAFRQAEARCIFERHIAGEIVLAEASAEMDAFHDRQFGPVRLC